MSKNRIKGATELLEEAKKRGSRRDCNFLESLYEKYNLESPQSKYVEDMRKILDTNNALIDGNIKLIMLLDLTPILEDCDYYKNAVFKTMVVAYSISQDSKDSPSKWAYYCTIYRYKDGKSSWEEELMKPPMTYEKLLVLLRKLFK